MRRIHGFFLILGVFIALMANAAIDDPATEVARVNAAKRMMTTLAWGQAYIGFAKEALTTKQMKDAISAEYAKWAVDQLTPEEVVNRLAPIYAKYLTVGEINEFERFFSTAPGDKVWPSARALILDGRRFVYPSLSQDERRKVDAFAAPGGVWWTLMNYGKPINADVSRMAHEWGREVGKQRYEDISQEFLGNLSHAATGSAAAAATISSTANMPPDKALVQQFYRVILGANAKNSQLTANYSAALQSIHIETILFPANLVSRAGIAESRDKLTRYEAEFSKVQRGLEQVSDEMITSLHQLNGPPALRDQLLKNAEAGAAARYELSMRFAENQRKEIALIRQILDLVDRRFGQIAVKDKQLLINDPEDLRQYNDLFSSLQEEIKREEALRVEENESRARALKTIADANGKLLSASSSNPTAKSASTLQTFSSQPLPALKTTVLQGDLLTGPANYLPPSDTKLIDSGPLRPVYPRESIIRGEEGVVMVGFSVLDDRQIIDIEVKRSSGYPRLDAAALAALKAWTNWGRLVQRTGKSMQRYALPIRFQLMDNNSAGESKGTSSVEGHSGAVRP